MTAEANVAFVRRGYEIWAEQGIPDPTPSG